MPAHRSPVLRQSEMRNHKVEKQNYKETTARKLCMGLATISLVLGAAVAHAHGDVTPQAVDISTLPPLGEDWRDVNPYRDNAEAIRIGDSAYNQNCARCHGLGAISGGIAPDLRKLDIAPETDEYFLSRIRKGVSRNGAVYMPPFEGILPQEAMWSIKAWLETVREK